MSTPTPRTDAEENQAYRFESSELVVKSSTTRTLETELTAALARIAELENLERRICKWVQARSITEDAPAGDLIQLMNDHDKRRLLRLDHYEREITSLTRQLSEAQAQLASAREDGARIEWIGREVAYFELCGTEFKDGRLISIGLDARIDIDSARGVTSPPAVAATGEKDAWQDIATAPKDGTDILLYLPYRIIEGGAMKAGSWLGHAWTYEPPDESWYNPTHWQPLPPPPTTKGKEE